MPRLKIAGSPVAEELDHERIIDDVDFYPMTSQKLLVAAKVDRIGDNHPANVELSNRAGTHQTRTKGGVEGRFTPAAKETGIGQAVGFAVKGNHPLLLPLVTSGSKSG